MSIPEQINQYMSLREPQRDAQQVLHEISATIDYKTASLDAVAAIATEKSIKGGKPWQYKLIPEDAVVANVDFRFTTAQCVKIT